MNPGGDGWLTGSVTLTNAINTIVIKLLKLFSKILTNMKTMSIMTLYIEQNGREDGFPSFLMKDLKTGRSERKP